MLKFRVIKVFQSLLESNNGIMKIQNILWYNLSIEKVLKILKTSRQGLSDKEALTRLKIFGFNRLPVKPRLSATKLFFRQFNNILIYILVVATGLSLFLRQWPEAAVVGAAIFINVFLGYFQENKAEKALEKLQKIITHKSRVYRDGLLKEINSEELVPGDIVVLEAGFQVSADLRLLEINNLSSAEAILTGEAHSIFKQAEPLSRSEDKKFLVAERANMVFKGTLIAEGKGLGVVVATGKITEVGKIAEAIEKTSDEETPLQMKLRSFSRKLGVGVLVIAAVILGVGLIRGLDFWEIFLIAVAAAVASVPEGLLVAVTVILTIGMQRILRQHALVRRLVAAETLGSTTVVCVDKTGTITEGEMSAKQLVNYNQELNFNDRKFPLGEFETLATVTLLCNNAVLENYSPEDYKIIGSPTEKAILAASLKFDWRDQLKDYQRLHEIPFTSRVKSMFTLNQKGTEFWWCSKGAPEIVLANCDRFQTGSEIKALDEEAKNHWLELFSKYSSRGARLLAAAYKVTDKKTDTDYKNEDYIFLGFWVINDPVRPEVKNTVTLAKQAGLRTIMITGDHRLTAVEIAKQIGLEVKENNVIDGYELMTMTPLELNRRVKEATVFARVSPEDKLKIVQALQAGGEVVAMTGDGINDAPALKAADIGISVGAASDVAKETSDMILLDNNFSTILAAVEQGRIIFQNIKKTIVFTLSDSFREIILVLGCLIAGVPLPIGAIQILWINLVSDGFPAAALTVEAAEPNIMKQRPEKRDNSILDAQMKTIIFVISIFSNLILFGFYYWLLKNNFDWSYIKALIFACLGLNSLVYVFSCKSLKQPVWRSHIFSNKFLWLAVLLGLILLLVPLYWPFIQGILGFSTLGLLDWALAFGLSCVQLVLIEGSKLISNYLSRTK